MAQHILVTGGVGYIGSHTTVELLAAGFEVTIVDSSPDAQAVLTQISELSGKTIPYFSVNLTDSQAVDRLFAENKFDGVIHFAALKAVGESVAEPLRYYRNNLVSTLNIAEAMQRHDVFQLVFSSSAAVYGLQEKMPITEDSPLHPESPYGHTKAMCEQILQDLAATDKRWQITLLRYFNPAGAHQSAKIGENPAGVPQNLSPFIARVAAGIYPEVRIFGDDYPTRDGTGVRDYIHVVDLARGHVMALQHQVEAGSAAVYNLGSGGGYSVLEMLHAFEKAAGHPIPHTVVERRPGDPAESYSDISKAKKELAWEPQKTVEDICADAWRWQEKIKSI